MDLMYHIARGTLQKVIWATKQQQSKLEFSKLPERNISFIPAKEINKSILFFWILNKLLIRNPRRDSNPGPGKRNRNYEAAALPLCNLHTLYVLRVPQVPILTFSIIVKT